MRMCMSCLVYRHVQVKTITAADFVLRNILIKVFPAKCTLLPPEEYYFHALRSLTNGIKK